MNANLWASPHKPTQEQLNELGEVVFLKELNPELFNTISNIHKDSDLDAIAEMLLIFSYTNGYTLVQPGGSPAFMFALGAANTRLSVQTKFAFSKRVSKDAVQADGSIVKTSVFVHEGFIIV